MCISIYLVILARRWRTISWWIQAEHFVPLGEDNLPLGEFWPVQDTPFDFREFAPLGQGLIGQYPQNQSLVNGYDHPWVLLKEEVPVEVVSPDGKVRLHADQPSSGGHLYLQPWSNSHGGSPYRI